MTLLVQALVDGSPESLLDNVNVVVVDNLKKKISFNYVTDL